MTPTRASSWLQARWPWLALALVTCASCAWRWRILQGSPEPLGVDGYFYLIQIRALLETGSLYYPSPPLSHWVMAAVAVFCDPLTAEKLVAAIGPTAGAIPMAMLVAKLTDDRHAALVGGAYYAMAGGCFYLSFEFVKNGLGVTLALLFATALLTALRAGTARAWCIAAVSCIAALATHRSAGAMCIGFSLAALVGIAWARRAALVPSSSRAMLALFALVAACAATLVAQTTNLRALARTALTTQPRFTSAVLDTGTVALYLDGDVWFAALLGAFTLTLGLRLPTLAAKHAERGVIVGTALTSFVLASPFIAITDPNALGFRLRVLAFIGAALCAGVLVAQLRARGGPLVRTAATWASLAAILTFKPIDAVEGVVQTNPNLVAAIQRLAPRMPVDALVASPDRRLTFMTTWLTRHRATLQVSATSPTPPWRLIPRRFGPEGLHHALHDAIVDPPERVPFAVPAAIADDREALVLLAAPTWHWVLTYLPSAERRAIGEAWGDER